MERMQKERPRQYQDKHQRASRSCQQTPIISIKGTQSLILMHPKCLPIQPIAIALIQRQIICRLSHRLSPKSPAAGWPPTDPLRCSCKPHHRSAPQRAGRTGRFYPTDTGDPSKMMGPQPCEQRWKCKPNRQDASGLQSCSDKSRGSLFLFQGNCTRDDLPR